MYLFLFTHVKQMLYSMQPLLLRSESGLYERVKVSSGFDNRLIFVFEIHFLILIAEDGGDEI